MDRLKIFSKEVSSRWSYRYALQGEGVSSSLVILLRVNIGACALNIDLTKFICREWEESFSTTTTTSGRASFRCETVTPTYCWSLRSALLYQSKLLVAKEATHVWTELCVTSGQPLMLGLLKPLWESLLMDQTHWSITLL